MCRVGGSLETCNKQGSSGQRVALNVCVCVFEVTPCCGFQLHAKQTLASKEKAPLLCLSSTGPCIYLPFMFTHMHTHTQILLIH